MRFWKIRATRLNYGGVTGGELQTRYLAFTAGVTLELTDKPRKKSSDVRTAILHVHHGGSGSSQSGDTGRYEITGMTASQAAKQIEALYASPAKTTTASLGVLPVGMMG